MSATRLTCSRNSSTVSNSAAAPMQLGQVLEPALGLDGVLGLELGDVAAPVEQRLEHRAGPSSSRSAAVSITCRNASMPRWARPLTPGVVGPAQRLGEREAVARGVGVEPADGAVAHAPLRHVEHPLDRHLVGRVHHRPQVGERVLDLAPVVEAGAADDLVRDAGPHERLLEHPALRVGPVEDRHVAPARVADLVQLRHLAGHPLRLVDLVLGVEAGDGLAAALVGPELLRLAAHVVGDDRVGGVEDGLGRPVVLLEQDHRGVGERLLELEDVGDVGAPEPVDRVVHEHAVGHVGVRRVDLEVVDRARVVLVLDRLDLGSHEPAVARRRGRACLAGGD